MGISNFTERRQHERARVQSIVVGILNSDEIVATGLINDISLGGVNFTHELGATPDATSVHSIDLIADSNYLNNIPCEFAWNSKVERKPYSSSKNLRQSGIQFVKLAPDQIFLLRRLINRCTSLGIKNITADVRLTFSK
jgi:hypothetical protein